MLIITDILCYPGHLKKKKKARAEVGEREKREMKSSYVFICSNLHSILFIKICQTYGLRGQGELHTHIPCVFHHKESNISQQIIKCSPI